MANGHICGARFPKSLCETTRTASHVSTLRRAQTTICSFAFHICDEKGISHLFSDNKAGKDWFYGFMRRNNDIVIRKAENPNYSRLMRFNKEIVSAHFELLTKTLDKMNLHNQRHVIYNVDESGLQFTYNCSQLVLDEKGCYITKEEFCNVLRHFNSHRIPGKALLIFDGHRSHLDNSVLDVAESLGIQLFCLPAHCSHELQPLDKSLFKSVKTYWNSAVENFRRKNPGSPLGNLQFGNLFTEAWAQAATLRMQLIPETAFAASDVSDLTPLQVRPTSSSATSCTLRISTIPATHTAPSTSNNIPTTSTSLATSVQGNDDQPSTAPVHKRTVKIRKNNDDMHCEDCGRNYCDKSMNVP
ncbi:hypothetical protein PR048_005839 [Dryococelus australis]|uniref:DDE-1 domain-containing protein n=1 Tax=Dryococelus australis TaxID=614101 RepID=A0ABQ9I9C2_9NEOP|nr:hypothetical protein PR048_005839 [Dryococelus australis]